MKAANPAKSSSRIIRKNRDEWLYRDFIISNRVHHFNVVDLVIN